MSDNIVELFDSLTIVENRLQTLNGLIGSLEDSDLTDEQKDDVCEKIKLKNRLPMLRGILEGKSDASIKAAAANVSADLAKTECIRDCFVKHNFIPPLITLLKDTNVSLVTQVCRALGNICFENDSGRDAVQKADGITTLLDLLISHQNTEGAEAKRLRVIGCGFLLNLASSHEQIQEKAISTGALDVLCDYMNSHRDDAELCHMIIATFTCLLDAGITQDELGCMRVSSSILSLMTERNSIEYQDSIYLLSLLAENDDIKEMLAVSDLPNTLVKVITENSWNAHADEDGEDIVTQAADLIVAMLRGDKSMQILYSNGDGAIINESLRWLESNNAHLEIAGSLAIGNFARNDDHCMKLVERKVVPQLLALLEDPKKSSITLQHGCLSALRNLAIPLANKPILVAAGVLPVVLKLVTVEVMPVVFKLLGVIRMLIDGQKEAALFVGNDSQFMTQLTEWCSVEEHAGVKGESTRLLAWLIKNTCCPTMHSVIVKTEAVGHLVSMVTSEHVIMQTEALLALTLMCHTVLAEATQQLKQAEIVKALSTVLSNHSCQSEVLCNALSLVQALTKQKCFRDQMLETSLDDVIEKLKSHPDNKVKKSATEVFADLTKGEKT